MNQLHAVERSMFIKTCTDVKIEITMALSYFNNLLNVVLFLVLHSTLQTSECVNLSSKNLDLGL